MESVIKFRGFFGCAHGMCKFPGQGLNPCHSSKLSRSSDNAGSLTCCAIRELLKCRIFIIQPRGWHYHTSLSHLFLLKFLMSTCKLWRFSSKTSREVIHWLWFKTVSIYSTCHYGDSLPRNKSKKSVPCLLQWRSWTMCGYISLKPFSALLKTCLE